ncbi:MAG: TRAP transporter fused permease subunit [Pyrodictiaceae archaeon]
MAGGEGEALSPFTVMAMRARKGIVRWTVFGLALFIALVEVFYVMNFQGTLVQFMRSLGLGGIADWLLFHTSINADVAYALVLAGLVAVGFLIFPIRRPPMKASDTELRRYMAKYIEKVPFYDYILAVLGFIAFLYVAWLYPKLLASEGALPPGSETVAVPIAILGYILIFELTRRTVGPWLVIVVTVFLLYYLNFWGFNLVKWASDMFYWKSGFFNIPYQVMAMYVFAFLFFGTFLERIGIGEYITTLMLSLFGKKPGGPAKVAIVSSGFMGMLSGSSVANVFTTGTFTIPLMKRSGFPPEVAGAVEASASTGGQIMPPIMGAAAFIMAAYLGRPYSDIVIAGFFPAFIYFASLYYFVDLEAKRRGLRGLKEEELPPLRPLLKKIYLISPVALITLLLVMHLPPQHSVVASLSLALVSALWATNSPLTRKLAYTISLVIVGLVAFNVGMRPLAAIYFTGIAFLLLSAALIVVPSYRGFARLIYESIEQAVRNSIPVFMAAAMAGVVQGSLTGTGLSTQMGEKLIEIAHGNLYLLLIFAGLISIVVGMGVPTTANYVITSLLSATAIAKAAQTLLGHDISTALLAAHMFVFYYGILADVTPPVALAAFAGATVARADFWKTGVNATRMAFTKYVLPFVFVVEPSLLILPLLEGHGDLEGLLWAVATLIAVIVSASAGFAGYLGGPINNPILRIALSIAGIAAVTTNPYAVLTAYILTVIAYLVARRSGRGQKEEHVKEFFTSRSGFWRSLRP